MDSDSDMSDGSDGRGGKKALLSRMGDQAPRSRRVIRGGVADAPSATVRNRQRVLLLSSRGILHRYRHLLNDVHSLLPHSKKGPYHTPISFAPRPDASRSENKMDSQKNNLTAVNELASDHQCNNCLFFEVRKHQDLFLWMARTPNGPSVKFLVHSIHTMDELRMTGNHLKGSRPILSFDKNFDNPRAPHLNLLKEMFTQTFATPRTSRKIKPFIDHVLLFSVVKDMIWFRNYQIVEKEDDRTKQSETSLVEVGPRFSLSIIRIFAGSFSGATLYENPDYISPNSMRSDARKEAQAKYVSKVAQKERKVEPKYAESVFKDVFV
ncbi:hypothetical protein HDU84_004701 [Entophlyctis sp. JEL0112]|nr:hypothetical protein HDU84_004701 [Entophlyctis sp. JEL0112]